MGVLDASVLAPAALHRQQPAFSLDEALARMEGDVELLREVVALLLDDGPAQLAAMRDAAQRHDLAALSRAAHSFKGAVGNLGASAAATALAELEHLARRGDPAIAAPLARAEAAWNHLEGELRRWANAA